jgi:acyl-coenzyme A thioesterase PaaI-like protein
LKFEVDRESETITMRFTAPDSFVSPRGSVQGGLVAGFLDEAMGWAHVSRPRQLRRGAQS